MTPTAWLNKERDMITFDNLFPEMTPLYEKREWVGLTDEERTEIRNKVQVYTSMDNIQYGLAIQHATETMLKEKNT